MKLSELKTGQRGVIVKVQGHGGFRKRIVEMGFIKGKTVEVLLNAPLQDPVKYRLMGYEISLRRDEARMIEVITEAEAMALSADDAQARAESTALEIEEIRLTDEQMRKAALKKRRSITVALVGNPNCGKTSLFNFVSGAHERVGNYSGVTVDAKEGVARFEGYEFRIVDLPGTYSLSAYSPEEMYVRREIIDHTPDIIINVIDASNLERNLLLTTQLVDMNLLMVGALNMRDEFEARGDSIDYKTLGQLFGVPMIPTVFKTGKGVEMLFHIIINMYEGVDFLDKNGHINPEVARDLQEWHKTYHGKDDGGGHDEDFAHGIKPRGNVYRHIHLNHGKHLEDSIKRVKAQLHDDEQIRHKYSTRYLAIKLLEKDKAAEDVVRTLDNGAEILATRDKEAEAIGQELKQDSETAIMDAKYGIIHGALREAGYKLGKTDDTYKLTHALDAIITNRYVGFPLFFLFLLALISLIYQHNRSCSAAEDYDSGHYPLQDVLACSRYMHNGISGSSKAIVKYFVPGQIIVCPVGIQIVGQNFNGFVIHDGTCFLPHPDVVIAIAILLCHIFFICREVDEEETVLRCNIFVIIAFCKSCAF